MTKGIKMLNTGSEMLDEILTKGKTSADVHPNRHGVGFKEREESTSDHKIISTRGQNQSKKIQKPCSVSKSNCQQQQKRRCHHCKKLGHNTEYCYDLYGKGRNKSRVKKKEWVKKETMVRNDDYTSQKKAMCGEWFLDSGCSRHMTGNSLLLTNLKTTKGQPVIFGGGAKGQVIGKGCLKENNMPELTEVLLVDGLTANLISISQLCDDGFSVIFSRDECEVKSHYSVVMRCKKSEGNCYIWNSSSRSK